MKKFLIAGMVVLSTLTMTASASADDYYNIPTPSVHHEATGVNAQTVATPTPTPTLPTFSPPITRQQHFQNRATRDIQRELQEAEQHYTDFQFKLNMQNIQFMRMLIELHNTAATMDPGFMDRMNSYFFQYSDQEDYFDPARDCSLVRSCDGLMVEFGLTGM